MIRVALATLMTFPFLTFFVSASEINISGSTSVARVMDVLAEHYNQTHPKTYIAVQGIGSTAGITLVRKGVSEIGMSSRYLTESEQDETITVKTIAMDGLAVIVNQSNQVNDISRDQLYDVYKGNITNWKQLGGEDKAIAVVAREASSGSQYSFESLLGLTKTVNGRMVSDISTDNLVVNSNSMVKTLINHNSHAIGFVSLGSVDRSIKAIQFEGVEPTSKNIVDKRYELARPFLVLYQTQRLDQESKSFLDYLKSVQAKKLITEYGYTVSK